MLNSIQIINNKDGIKHQFINPYITLGMNLLWRFSRIKREVLDTTVQQELITSFLNFFELPSQGFFQLFFFFSPPLTQIKASDSHPGRFAMAAKSQLITWVPDAFFIASLLLPLSLPPPATILQCLCSTSKYSSTFTHLKQMLFQLYPTCQYYCDQLRENFSHKLNCLPGFVSLLNGRRLQWQTQHISAPARQSRAHTLPNGAQGHTDLLARSTGSC